MTRRDWILSAMAAGLAGSGCRSLSRTASAVADAVLEPFRPTAALSFRGVAARAGRLVDLGGLNRLVGVSIENDGDVLLLGHREPSWPSVHIDDLVIALRSAFKAGPRYQEPIGCSIDPREGEADPWQMQKVSTFGMEDSRMAARHVAIDYELKKASLGLTVLKPGMPSLLDNSTRQVDCSSSQREGPTHSAHRFWFCPRVADAPRFVRDGEAIWIHKPVGAQVLTEEEFLDSKAHRVGARPAEGAAVAFARAASELLASGALPHYAALRGDFRLIEAAKLVAVLGASPAALGYFLSEHVVRKEKVPKYVGGLWREETLEITCANTVTETDIPGGKSYAGHADIRKNRQRVIGGVEGRVPIVAKDVRTGNQELSAVMQRVRSARPSADAAIWPVAA